MKIPLFNIISNTKYWKLERVKEKHRLRLPISHHGKLIRSSSANNDDEDLIA